MDKKYLKENNLLEAHKQFMRLCEYVSVPLTEEGEDEEPNADGDIPMQGGDMGAQGGDMQMTGNDMNAQGGDMQMSGNDMNTQGDDMGAQGNDMVTPDGDMSAQGGDMPMADGDPTMGMQDPMMGGEEEEVIDVEDITNAQEKMNDKVNSVGRNLNQVDDRITKLLQTIDKMEQMINANNAEIEAFKKEFEKRNPTPTEKLNLRSLDSYPFNVNPKDYWAEKGIANAGTSSYYNAYSDNSEPTAKEYEITNNDVDNFDERKVANSFFIDDDLRQTLGKIFDL